MPIAAVHANHVTVVAGLVAGEGVVRAMATRDGRWLWTVDVERGASWAADAQLRLEAAGDGVALLWRGGHSHAHTGTAYLLGPEGELRGDSQEVGPAFCTTSAGLAWTVPEAHGPVHVHARAWSEPRARDMLAVPPGRAPALVCGERLVFVLGDGDDDLTEASFAPGDVSATPPMAVIRDADFSEDELEHEAYAVHDDLEILRVASSGTLASRRVPASGPVAPWHNLRRRLLPDDDVVSIDGDEAGTLIVLTREAAAPCPGTEAPPDRVLALRVERKANVEEVVDLVAADCEHAPAPIWIARSREDSRVVGWAVRRARPRPHVAPIAGLAYRAFVGGAVRFGKVDIDADAIVDAGCDDNACYAAALERGADSDGAQAMSIAVLKYQP